MIIAFSRNQSKTTQSNCKQYSTNTQLHTLCLLTLIPVSTHKTMEIQNDPLLIAAQNGHATIVLCLIKNGAYINHVNKNGETPLYLAAKNGHEDVVSLLIKHGAYFTRTDDAVEQTAKDGPSDQNETPIVASGTQSWSSTATEAEITCPNCLLMNVWTRWGDTRFSTTYASSCTCCLCSGK